MLHSSTINIQQPGKSATRTGKMEHQSTITTTIASVLTAVFQINLGQLVHTHFLPPLIPVENLQDKWHVLWDGLDALLSMNVNVTVNVNHEFI